MKYCVVNCLFASMLVLFGGTISVGAESEPKQSKIILISRWAPVTNESPSSGMSAPINALFYGFGFENDYDYIVEVDFLGRNLARAMKPVPEASGWMNAYMWSRVGAVSALAGGIVFTALYSIREFAESSGNEEERIPSRPFNRTPMFIGLGITGMGLSLEISRHFWIRIATREFNRKLDDR